MIAKLLLKEETMMTKGNLALLMLLLFPSVLLSASFDRPHLYRINFKDVQKISHRRGGPFYWANDMICDEVCTPEGCIVYYCKDGVCCIPGDPASPCCPLDHPLCLLPFGCCALGYPKICGIYCCEASDICCQNKYCCPSGQKCGPSDTCTNIRNGTWPYDKK